MLPLSALDSAGLADVGGKALNLGAMHRAGFPVPAGFCLTTAAFAELTAGIEAFPALVDQLDARSAADAEGIRSAAAAVRAAIEEAALPPALLDELREAAAGLRPGRPLAVRSSATLEDLPDASFAGQQDTYLGVVGEEALVDAVRRCFASLFTERAAVYRRQHGFGSRGAALAVVVQEMVPAEVSGILFTADPVSGHRGVCSIDASYGLGEALVSGRVNADLYRVDKSTGAVLERRAGDKGLAIHLLEGGGTEERAPAEAERARLCLDDAQLAALVNLARRVEERQGAPQDIEWAFAEASSSSCRPEPSPRSSRCRGPSTRGSTSI